MQVKFTNHSFRAKKKKTPPRHKQPHARDLRDHRKLAAQTAARGAGSQRVPQKLN